MTAPAPVAGPVTGLPADALLRLARHGLLEAAGAATPAEIVEEVYAEVDPRLYPVAAQTVEAHLRKLEREGRVGTYLEGGRTKYEVRSTNDE